MIYYSNVQTVYFYGKFQEVLFKYVSNNFTYVLRLYAEFFTCRIFKYEHSHRVYSFF